MKLSTLDDISVKKPNHRLPPESNKDIKEDVVATLRPGSIGCGDGGTAIASSVRAAGGGQVPLAYAVHGRKPCKQFTRLTLLPKAHISEALQVVLKRQDRWKEKSAHVRVIGGNQHAESEWGTRNMNLKQRCVHRGRATQHSTAHALCGIFLSHKVGLRCFGTVWKKWLEHYVDKGPPNDVFCRSGWTGVGASSDDKHTSRIVCGGQLDDLGKGKLVEGALKQDNKKKPPPRAEDPEAKRARLSRACEGRNIKAECQRTNELASKEEATSNAKEEERDDQASSSKGVRKRPAQKKPASK